jgi:hypothetical protein
MKMIVPGRIFSQTVALLSQGDLPRLPNGQADLTIIYGYDQDGFLYIRHFEIKHML